MKSGESNTSIPSRHHSYTPYCIANHLIIARHSAHHGYATNYRSTFYSDEKKEPFSDEKKEGLCITKCSSKIYATNWSRVSDGPSTRCWQLCLTTILIPCNNVATIQYLNITTILMTCNNVAII